MTRQLTAKEKAQHALARAARQSAPKEAPVDETQEETVDQGGTELDMGQMEQAEATRAPEAAAPAETVDVDLAPAGQSDESDADAGEEEPDEFGDEAGGEVKADASLPKEWIILRSLASYGPVKITGKMQRCKKGVLYWVPDIEERSDILGTGRFRSATLQDLTRSRQPSSGPGVAVTRDLLPPGALKGGQK